MNKVDRAVFYQRSLLNSFFFKLFKPQFLETQVFKII
jgi:hypothetical protein